MYTVQECSIMFPVLRVHCRFPFNIHLLQDDYICKRTHTHMYVYMYISSKPKLRQMYCILSKKYIIMRLWTLIGKKEKHLHVGFGLQKAPLSGGQAAKDLRRFCAWLLQWVWHPNPPAKSMEFGPIPSSFLVEVGTEENWKLGVFIESLKLIWE